MELKYLFVFILFYLNIATINTVCIQGENCPNGQGFCIQSECVCSYGFTTFGDNTTNNPIYCNYRQINRFIPLILEFFFPSIGLFYLGRIFHGLVKLILGISSFVCRASGEQNLNTFSALIILAFASLYFGDLIRLLLGKITDGNGVPVL